MLFRFDAFAWLEVVGSRSQWAYQAVLLDLVNFDDAAAVLGCFKDFCMTS